MNIETIEERSSLNKSGSYISKREVEIDNLADMPTGAPMEGRHWAFLLVSGIVLPVLILLWGWQ